MKPRLLRYHIIKVYLFKNTSKAREKLSFQQLHVFAYNEDV